MYEHIWPSSYPDSAQDQAAPHSSSLFAQTKRTDHLAGLAQATKLVETRGRCLRWHIKGPADVVKGSRLTEGNCEHAERDDRLRDLGSKGGLTSYGNVCHKAWRAGAAPFDAAIDRGLLVGHGTFR